MHSVQKADATSSGDIDFLETRERRRNIGADCIDCLEARETNIHGNQTHLNSREKIYKVHVAVVEDIRCIYTASQENRRNIYSASLNFRG